MAELSRLDRKAAKLKLSGWKWWACMLGAAASLRALVALVLLGGMPLVSDARDYFDGAMHFAAGDFGGAFYWPPGQSLVLACVLATISKSVLVGRILTVAMSLGGVALSALLARELAGGAAGKAAGWMAALYPPSVLLCGQTYAQHLAAFCVATIAYFGLRAFRERRIALFVVTGAALGIGCLTRPSMASIVPVLAAAWGVTAYRHRESLRVLAGGAIAMACASVVFVLPVQAHDWRAGAGWTVSTNNERNLFLGNNPYTPDYKTSHLGQRSLDELSPDARSYLESFYRRPDARSAMRHEAVSYMVHHPLRTAWRTLNRATSFWGFDYLGSREIQRWRNWRMRTALPLLMLEAGSYLAVAVLALVGVFVFSSACVSPWRSWLVALTLAYELPYAIAFSGGTYHFPVIPLVIPFAALTAVHGVEAWRRARATRRAIAALVAFAAIQAEYAYFAFAMRPDESLRETAGTSASAQDATRVDLEQ